MRYRINEGRREFAIRLGCEKGVYLFIHDYAKEMGMSMSGALRRLALIGARCEAEHGNRTMPAAYNNLKTGPDRVNDDIFNSTRTLGDEL